MQVLGPLNNRQLLRQSMHQFPKYPRIVKCNVFEAFAFCIECYRSDRRKIRHCFMQPLHTVLSVNHTADSKMSETLNEKEGMQKSDCDCILKNNSLSCTYNRSKDERTTVMLLSYYLGSLGFPASTLTHF